MAAKQSPESSRLRGIGNPQEQKEAVRLALTQSVWNSLRPVSLALTILYALFAIGHLLLLPNEVKIIMTSFAGGTAFLLFALAQIVRKIKFSERLTYPVAFVILLIAIINSLLHLFLTDDVLQTTNLILVVFGAGYFILSTYWFLASLIITLASWISFVAILDQPAYVVHFGIALSSAAFISYIFHRMRKRTLGVQEVLRLLNEAQHKEVEKALELSEQQLVELQEREERIRAIINTTVDGIITISETGKIQSFNPAAELIFGYQEEEVIGQNVHLLMPEPYHGEHDGYIDSYMSTREPKIIGIGREVRGIRKNGQIFPLALAVSNVELPGRTLFTGIVRDITERKLTEEALDAARERLEKEIELAAHIQASILPRELPRIVGFEFAAHSLAARFLSGDFYDFIPFDEHQCQIILGDIAGKGIPAALMTLSTRALIRNETNPKSSVPDILRAINKLQYLDLSQAEIFVTLFLARIDGHKGEFRYASAGHGEALLWRNLEGNFTPILATGLPIGIFPDETYQDEVIAMRPGDLIVIYSDGVTDAINLQGELFGIDRLVSLIQESSSFSASEVSRQIIQTIEHFSQGVDQEDDITIVVVKALPRRIAIEFAATLAHLDQIVKNISQQAAVFSQEYAYEWELACSEIVTNIIEHAYGSQGGEIQAEVHLLKSGLQLDLYDQGEPFDYVQLQIIDNGTLQEGGYGLEIVQQIMDEVHYQPATDQGNHWRLVKYIQ